MSDNVDENNKEKTFFDTILDFVFSPLVSRLIVVGSAIAMFVTSGPLIGMAVLSICAVSMAASFAIEYTKKKTICDLQDKNKDLDKIISSEIEISQTKNRLLESENPKVKELLSKLQQSKTRDPKSIDEGMALELAGRTTIGTTVMTISGIASSMLAANPLTLIIQAISTVMTWKDEKELNANYIKNIKTMSQHIENKNAVLGLDYKASNHQVRLELVKKQSELHGLQKVEEALSNDPNATDLKKVYEEAYNSKFDNLASQPQQSNTKKILSDLFRNMFSRESTMKTFNATENYKEGKIEELINIKKSSSHPKEPTKEKEVSQEKRKSFQEKLDIQKSQRSQNSQSVITH